MKRIIALFLAAGVVMGCKPRAGASGPSGANAACTGQKVDLSKITGDWMVSGPIGQPEGNFAGTQYRLRFAGPPAADGTVKAILAWRLDSRPFTGTLTTNAMGGSIDMLEDMTPETIDSLKKANNQDPHLPMRASIRVEPEETGCGIQVTDNAQTFVGDKVIENSMLGLLHLVPMKSAAEMSFVRCDVQRGVYFDGKADDGGRPVTVTPGKTIAIKSEADRAAFPKECTAFDADVFVDGSRVTAKLPGKADDKEVVFESTITAPSGAPHGVELHAYAECGTERKLVASACNLLLTQ
jgi:hypothetical protein